MIEKSLFSIYIDHSGYGAVYLLGSGVDNVFARMVNSTIADFSLALCNMDDPTPPPFGLLPRFPYHFPLPTSIATPTGFEELLNRIGHTKLSPGAKHFLLCLYGRVRSTIELSRRAAVESKFLDVMKKGRIYQCDAFQVSLFAPCRDVGTPVFPRIITNKGSDGSGLCSLHFFRDRFRLDAAHVYTSTHVADFAQSYVCPDLETYQPSLEDAFFTQGVRTSTWLLSLMEKASVWKLITPQSAMYSIRYQDAEIDALLFNQLHATDRFFHPSLSIAEIVPKNLHLALADYFNPIILDSHIATYQNLSAVLAYAMSPTNGYWMSREWKQNLKDISDCALACGFGVAGESKSVLGNIEVNSGLKDAETTANVASLLVDACKKAIAERPGCDPLGPLPFGASFIEYYDSQRFNRKGIENKYLSPQIGSFYG